MSVDLSRYSVEDLENELKRRKTVEYVLGKGYLCSVEIRRVNCFRAELIIVISGQTVELPAVGHIDPNEGDLIFRQPKTVVIKKCKKRGRLK